MANKQLATATKCICRDTNMASQHLQTYVQHHEFRFRESAAGDVYYCIYCLEEIDASLLRTS